MTRIVGNQNRSEFILDPSEAWARGRVLDKMLLPGRVPARRGVTRATHKVFNAMDDQRQLDQARLLNGKQVGPANPSDEP